MHSDRHAHTEGLVADSPERWQLDTTDYQGLKHVFLREWLLRAFQWLDAALEGLHLRLVVLLWALGFDAELHQAAALEGGRLLRDIVVVLLQVQGIEIVY